MWVLFLKEEAVSLSLLISVFVNYAVIILNGRKTPPLDFFTSFSNQYYAVLKDITMWYVMFSTLA